MPTATAKYEDGTVACFDYDSGKKLWEKPMARCVHCCTPFPLKPGSGIRRGYCFNCGGLHCGQEGCRECNGGLSHWEARFEVLEGTRNPTSVLIAVPKPQSPKLAKKLLLPWIMKE